MAQAWTDKNKEEKGMDKNQKGNENPLNQKQAGLNNPTGEKSASGTQGREEGKNLGKNRDTDDEEEGQGQERAERSDDFNKKKNDQRAAM